MNSSLVPSTAYLELETSTADEYGEADAIVIAPNPTDGWIRLKVKTIATFDFEVTNLAGMKLISQTDLYVGEKELTINLTPYPSGMYLLHIIYEGKSYTRKIIRL